MAIEDIQVVSVPVSDQDRAKQFYVHLLGFTLVKDDTSVPGIRWISVAPSGGRVVLTLVTWFGTMPAGSLRGLVMRSGDIESDYQKLLARGVEFEGPPAVQPWGTETVFRDPDGNEFVLQQSHEPGEL